MITEAQLKRDLLQLENSPNDPDLLNRIALGYLQNPVMSRNREELQFFERAYVTQPTVTSIHNLAFYLYFEACGVEGSTERSIALQKQCIALKPQSSFPYVLYGSMLLRMKQYEQAATILEIAFQKSQSNCVLHNLAIAYFHQDKFEIAEEKFKPCIDDDPEGLSLYNLAVTYFHLKKYHEAAQCLESIARLIQQKGASMDLSGHNLAEVYAAMGEYEKAYAHIPPDEWDYIDIVDWTGVALTIFNVNPQLFIERLADSMAEPQRLKHELETNPEKWADETEEKKWECLATCRKEIKIREEFAQKLSQKQIPIELEIWSKRNGCLLFGCDCHDNLVHDAAS